MWIGSYDDVCNDELLNDRQITHILCCGEELDLRAGYPYSKDRIGYKTIKRLVLAEGQYYYYQAMSKALSAANINTLKLADGKEAGRRAREAHRPFRVGPEPRGHSGQEVRIHVLDDDD
jgi:hypothetical protein